VSQRADGGWSLTEVACSVAFEGRLARDHWTNRPCGMEREQDCVLSDKEILGLARCIEQ
jgi:hypothetical protein